jgi:hypothetical protein
MRSSTLLDSTPGAEVPAGRAAPSRAATVLALGGWLALVAICRWWGLAVVRAAPEPLYVDAVPFFGRWGLEVAAPLAVAAVVLAGAAWLLPAAGRLLAWRRLLAISGGAAVVVALSLALVEPPAERWSSLHDDYGQHTALVDEQGVGGFLRGYTDRQPTAPTHLSAHPPGTVLLLWAEQRVGLGGTAGQVGTEMAGVAAAVVAMLVAVRSLAGESWARAAAPFLVVAPAAVWHTNADVVFGAIPLVGLALLAVAGDHRGWAASVRAAAGGLLLGGGLFFSQGLVLMGAPALAILWYHRRLRLAVVAAAAALVAVCVPLLWGFSWIAGLAATKEAYDLNLARVRPYGYFLVANVAVFAVAVGPAVAVALVRLRNAGVRVLVGGGLLAVLAADVSGMSLAETERIWQPFMPLVLLAGAALAVGRPGRGRGWLWAQAATTLVLVAFLRSPW